MKCVVRLAILTAAGLLVTTPAAAQYAEYEATAPPASAGTPEVSPPVTAKVEEASPSHTEMRFSAVGAYRGIYDVGLAGGGIDLAIGGDYPLSGAFELRILGGRSLGGLGFADVAAMGSVMARLGGGPRIGFAVGVETLMIARATTGDLMGSGGLTGLMRLGYDFGRGKQGFFAEGDATFLYMGTLAWGPTLGAGYRF
ncbi:MAG TPA: hypothetical protein VIY73_07695 [Polyangiaceae bacterium]